MKIGYIKKEIKKRNIIIKENKCPNCYTELEIKNRLVRSGRSPIYAKYLYCPSCKKDLFKMEERQFGYYHKFI